MNAFMDIAVVMVASHISHLASRISHASRTHLAFRIPPLVLFVSFPAVLYLGLVISSSHCRAATVFTSSESPPPPLSSAAFRIAILFRMVEFKEGKCARTGTLQR